MPAGLERIAVAVGAGQVRIVSQAHKLVLLGPRLTAARQRLVSIEVEPCPSHDVTYTLLFFALQHDQGQSLPMSKVFTYIHTKGKLLRYKLKTGFSKMGWCTPYEARVGRRTIAWCPVMPADLRNNAHWGPVPLTSVPLENGLITTAESANLRITLWWRSPCHPEITLGGSDNVVLNSPF